VSSVIAAPGWIETPVLFYAFWRPKLTKLSIRIRQLLLLLLLLMAFIWRKLRKVQQMHQVSCCMVTVILEEEHFQSFPEHWQWNVQQTEFGWKTVLHDLVWSQFATPYSVWRYPVAFRRYPWSSREVIWNRAEISMSWGCQIFFREREANAYLHCLC